MIVGKVALYKKKKIMLLSVKVRELRALKVVNAKISNIRVNFIFHFWGKRRVFIEEYP